jgi:hypothetical protein
MKIQMNGIRIEWKLNKNGELTMSAFSDALNKRSDDIKAPPVLPQGAYIAMVDGLPEEVTSKNGTSGGNFKFKILKDFAVTDQDTLAISGGAAGKTMFHTFWISEDPQKKATSEYMFKRFLTDHLGCDGGNMKSMVDSAPGKMCLINVTHDVTPDGRIRAQIGSFGKTPA